MKPIWGKKEEFLDRVYRRSHSIHSKRYYSFGIEKFRQFCEAKGLEVNKGNVYTVIDSFVADLDKKGMKPKTIADYVSALRKFLPFAGIDIDPLKFKAKVVMPRVTKIADQPLTLEDVRGLLTRGRPNPKIRALILTLLSSGMRIGETLSLTVKDINLESNPPRVTIRAEYAKTRTGRIAYFSDEAATALKEVVKGQPPERLVFDYSGDLWEREKLAVRTFRAVVERAGLDERLENHRTHRIHFHSFRKFFLTKAVDLIGDHAGHALCGHGFYMDTYYRKSEEERDRDFLRLMPSLTVFGQGEKGNLKTDMKREILTSVAGYSEEEAEKLDLASISDKDFQKMVRERLLGAMANNGSRQRVIQTGGVEQYIQQGWEYVATLPDDRAILKLPV